MAALRDIVAATIHGQDVSLYDLLYFLKINENLGFLHEAIDGLLVAEEATRAGITVSVEELQHAVDDFRRARGLYKAAETMQWLQQRHLTTSDLGARLAHALKAEKLRQQVAEGKIERYFAENRSVFDTAKIAHIVVAKEGVASELFSQITEEEADFATLARKHSLDSVSRDAGGYVGVVRRKTLSPAVEVAVFTAQAGAVVGPVKTDMGYHVIQVQAIAPGVLDDRTRAAIQDLLFADWLRAEARKANVALQPMELL